MPNGNLQVTLPGGESPSMVVGNVDNDLVVAIPGGPEITFPGGLAVGGSGAPLQVSFPTEGPFTVGTSNPVGVEFPPGSSNGAFDLIGNINIVELPQGGEITVELTPDPRPTGGARKIKVRAKSVLRLRGTSTQTMAS